MTFNRSSAEAHAALALCLRKLGWVEEALAEHRAAMLLQGEGSAVIEFAAGEGACGSAISGTANNFLSL